MVFVEKIAILPFIVSLCLADSENVFNITRILNSGDVFWYHTEDENCDPKSCSTYSALSLKSSPCHCQCSNGKPVFLQHIKQCSSIIDIPCRLISFIDLHNVDGYTISIPTIFLPLTGEVLNPSLAPYWSGLNIGNDSNGLVPCNVSGMAYLTNTGWIERPILFSLINVNGYSYLQWLGTMLDQIELTGKLVQVSVQCDFQSDFCFAFRIIGKDIMPFGALSRQITRKKQTNNQNDQFGLIVGIICGIFLTATLLGVAIFWFFCWRQKRRAPNVPLTDPKKFYDQADNYSNYYVNQSSFYERPSEPYVFQQRQVQQHNRYTIEASSSSSRPWSQNETICQPPFQYNNDYRFNSNNYYFGNEQYLNPMILSNYYDGQYQKNLPHFTAEFFRPEFMNDPPEAAEHFLQDVRQRMSQIRCRNRTKKYTPNLPGICEERESELGSSCAGSSNEQFLSDASSPSTIRSLKGVSEKSTVPSGAGDSSDSSESFKESNDSGIETDKRDKEYAHGNNWLSQFNNNGDIQTKNFFDRVLKQKSNNVAIRQSTVEIAHV